MLTDAGQSRDELVDFLWEVVRDGYRIVEVTPDAVRIRKVVLDQTVRGRSAARARNRT